MRSGRRRPGGGEAVQVTTNGGIIALESTDGRFVYYTKELDGYRVTSLWKLPVDGGEESEILKSVHNERNFAVVPEGIYFMQSPDQDALDWAHSIWFLDYAGDSVELVFQLPSKVPVGLGLNVSPDGASILYSQIDDFSSDLMMIENFR